LVITRTIINFFLIYNYISMKSHTTKSNKQCSFIIVDDCMASTDEWEKFKKSYDYKSIYKNHHKIMYNLCPSFQNKCIN
jgi:hypothetical protein